MTEIHACGLNTICSISLTSFPNDELNTIAPNYMIYAHDFEICCMSQNESMDMLASIDISNCLMIHTLRTGIALNRIQLGSSLLKIKNIWLNLGYVTISGEIKSEVRSSDQRILQSVSINGEYVGMPLSGSRIYGEVNGDSIKIINSTDDSYANCLSGKIEKWSCNKTENNQVFEKHV